MKIVVLANWQQKEELGSIVSDNVVYVDEAEGFLQHKEADAFIDLQFSIDERRISLLDQLQSKLVIVSSVIETLDEINSSFVRINAWPTFLSSSLIEGTFKNKGAKQQAEEVFSFFNKQIEWLPDEPGFIRARVVSMIINEAYIALEEGVSTKEEIDTAMKLGTNYPHGPFEWAEKIGVQNVVTLLQKLRAKQSRYKPAGLLVQEANRIHSTL